jgi:hypothetical protein
MKLLLQLSCPGLNAAHEVNAAQQLLLKVLSRDLEREHAVRAREPRTEQSYCTVCRSANDDGVGQTDRMNA